MGIELDKTITKLLLSSTSRFVGEFRTEDVLLTHAWAASRDHIHGNLGIFEGPLSRNFFVLSFRHPEFKKDRIVFPDYTPTGDLYCTYLSILFGKQFENHGLLESHGDFRIPSLPSENRTITPWLPFNSHRERADVSVPLNLCEVGRLALLLQDDSGFDSRFIHFLTAAGNFYAKALRVAEDDPETAYLNLITCGEILSNFFDYKDEQLFDEQSLKDLQEIATNLEDGVEIAKRIKQRLFQVKRRFCLTITSLLSEGFFTNHESTEDYYALKRDDIEHRVNAAYDLRSRYVHTGIAFGSWVGYASQRYVEEVQPSKPVIKDKEFKKIIASSPTFVGLERIMRFCLLRFMHRNGVEVDDSLR